MKQNFFMKPSEEFQNFADSAITVTPIERGKLPNFQHLSMPQDVDLYEVIPPKFDGGRPTFKAMGIRMTLQTCPRPGEIILLHEPDEWYIAQNIFRYNSIGKIVLTLVRGYVSAHPLQDENTFVK